MQGNTIVCVSVKLLLILILWRFFYHFCLEAAQETKIISISNKFSNNISSWLNLIHNTQSLKLKFTIYENGSYFLFLRLLINLKFTYKQFNPKLSIKGRHVYLWMDLILYKSYNLKKLQEIDVDVV